MIGILLAVALAAPADRAAVDPGVEPSDVEEQYRAFAASKGRKGDRAELVCRPFAEGADLCFSRMEKDKRVYYTRADKKDVATLEAEGRGTAEAAFQGFEPTAVEGFTARYWLRAQGDGRDHVPALFPDELRAKVGSDVVIAVPARGVFVAWVPGSAEFDKVVAVGVRRMFETLPDPVSPLLYRWNGREWETWGQARVAKPAQTAEPAAR